MILIYNDSRKIFFSISLLQSRTGASMSNRPDSNVLFSRHLPEMRAYLQLDGFALHLVQRGLLTEREVIYLYSLEGGDLQCCHLVRLVKKTRNAFESFVEALEEEVASDYSANAHGHRQLLENMRDSLASLHSLQQCPRSRSGSFLMSGPETDSPARSPSPLSSISYSSRQSPSSTVSLDLSPSPRRREGSDSSSISTADSLKALGELAQKVMAENWELRAALEHKKGECEDLKKELGKVQQVVKRPTKIPEPSKVPLVHNRRSYYEAVSEGCLCTMEQTQASADKGTQRSIASTSVPSFRAASSQRDGKGPPPLGPVKV